MIKYIKGDLFTHTAPKSSTISIFVHACNCRGSWGGGIPTTFYRKLPSAYKIYADYCSKHANDPSKLLGTTLLIPSSPRDPGNENGQKTIYVACLFTSDLYGKKKLPPTDIVANTDLSMQDLNDQLKLLEIEKEIESTDNGKLVVNMPKINAGLFAVSWENTEDVLRKFNNLHINVYVVD